MTDKILIDKAVLQQALDMLTIGKRYAKALMLNQELFDKASVLLREALAAPQPAPNAGCWCSACRPVTMSDIRMVLCPTCGNKRCPKATDHRHACTNSNEAGQPGSSYPALAAPATMTSSELASRIERGEPWAVAPQPAQEPVAHLHDDGCWTAAKTEAGRLLNERLLFAGSPKISVYTAPQSQTAQPAAPARFDAEFLSKRLGRVAELVGIKMPDMTHEQIAEVAGTILGCIARRLEMQPAQPADIPKIGCVNHDCDKCKAAPAQEPVGTWVGDCIEWTENPYKFKHGQKIYTTPQPQPAQEPMAWQPIEIAPKGQIVLVHYKNSLGNGRTMRAAYYLPETLESDTEESGWADEGWYEESEAYEYLMPLECEPTHWMLLPPAPDTIPQPQRQPNPRFPMPFRECEDSQAGQPAPAPVRPPPQPLTDEQIAEIGMQAQLTTGSYLFLIFARLIEQAHGITGEIK